MSGALVSILIPVYNNAMYLRELHQRIVDTLEAAAIPFEVLMVDDGSRDESWSLIKDIAARDPRVKGLCLSRNFGQHAAISAALEHASGHHFVLMDADLQDRPEMIPELLAPLEGEGKDVVYTLKDGGEEGWSRRLTSKAFHDFVAHATRSQNMSGTGTFRAFNRKIASALLAYRERAIVYGPLMHTMGYDATFVRVPRDPRQGSGSSYTFSKRLALAFQSIVSYSTLPQRAMLWTGGVVCALSIGYLLLVVLQYLMGGRGLPEGMTMILTLMLFLIGIVMLGMGVLASYLFLIFRETLDRPRYHVHRAVNLESGT